MGKVLPRAARIKKTQYNASTVLSGREVPVPPSLHPTIDASIIKPQAMANANLVSSMYASPAQMLNAKNAAKDVDLSYDKIAANPESLKNLISQQSHPSTDLSAETDAEAKKRLEENKGQATYDNLKRRRSSRFMGTDAAETQKLVQELLIKKKLQEAVVRNPHHMRNLIDDKVANDPRFKYLKELSENTIEIQNQGAIAMDSPEAQHLGFDASRNVLPGAHLVIKDSPLHKLIQEQSRQRHEEREKLLAKQNLQLPKKFIFIAVSLILSSYTFNILWDIEVEINNGEPPLWYQFALAQYKKHFPATPLD